MRIQVAACHSGAQDAFAHVGLYLGLHLSNCGIVNLCRMKTDRLCVDRLCRLNIWQRLKHPINHTHMKVHMRVQAGGRA